jgi:hypothetical protein
MSPAPQSLIPLLDRLTSLIAWLADRIAGFGDHAGGDQARRDHAGADQAGLEPKRADTLLARLRHLAARFRAVAGTPIPPPKPASGPPSGPAEPRFVPTHSFRFVPVDPPPERTGLPRAWRWLLRLVPQAAAGRAQLEELLRDPAMADMLATDPRLGPILRPLGWMLGVDRALLPASRRRRRPVILVPGGGAQAAAAAADYAAARAKAASGVDVLALCCVPAAGRRDRRLVWRGCAGLAPPGGAEIPA